MSPDRRNLGLELAAIILFQVSLLVFLPGGYYLAILLFTWLSPNEEPVVINGLLVGPREISAAALPPIVISLILIAIAWGLRALVSRDEEVDP